MYGSRRVLHMTLHTLQHTARQRMTAVAMAQHSRLGAHSLLTRLDPLVLRLILQAGADAWVWT
eukprot:1709507-Rhodomonas_salina.1